MFYSTDKCSPNGHLTITSFITQAPGLVVMEEGSRPKIMSPYTRRMQQDKFISSLEQRPTRCLGQ